MDPVLNKTLLKLSERAKELECLYKVEEAVTSSQDSEDMLFRELTRVIPSGMQFPTVCEVQISYGNKKYQSEDYRESEWFIRSDLKVNNEIVGQIRVVYTQFIRSDGNKQFLAEEQKLLDIIASRISCWLFVLVVKASGPGGSL